MTFENEDPTTDDRGGDPQDVDTTNPEEQPDDDNETQEDDQESNPNEQELRESKNLAVAEAIRNHKKAKSARAEADTLRQENDLLKYASKGDLSGLGKKLSELQEENPELVEEIASRNWGMTSSQLKQAIAEQGTDDKGASVQDIEALIDQKLSAKETKERSKNVEEAENQFFIEQGIDPTSRTFKNVLDEYTSLKNDFGNPKSAQAAKKLLRLAYVDYNKNVMQTGDDDNVSLPSSPKSAIRKRDTKQKRSVSPDMKAFMTDTYGKQVTADFLAGKQVKFNK